MEFNYKSSDILIARIKENLSSYDSAGIVDIGKFYFYIKQQIQLLGYYLYQEEIEILEIENNKAKLPNDFIKLYALYLLKEENVSSNNLHLQTDKVYKSFNKECSEESEIIRIKTYIKAEQYDRLPNNILLRYSGKVNNIICDSQCPNFFSKEKTEFNLDNNYIYLNISKGILLLKYLKFPLDEEGYPLIPDIPIIEQCIEDYIIYKTLEYYYINDITNNALQKMQYYQEKYKTSYKSALSYVKLPSFQQCIESAHRQVKNKFNIFELKTNGKYSYNTTNRH